MRFPYGLANFQALIEEGYLYIDRTDRIRRIEDGGKQLLLLRHQIRESKILDFLMEKAKVEEAPDPESQEESSEDEG